MKGKVIIPFINSNKTLNVKPSTLKGRRMSQRIANMTIPTIARGQHKAKRINQSNRAMKNLMLLEFSLTNRYYGIKSVKIHISLNNCIIFYLFVNNRSFSERDLI